MERDHVALDQEMIRFYHNTKEQKCWWAGLRDPIWANTIKTT